MPSTPLNSLVLKIIGELVLYPRKYSAALMAIIKFVSFCYGIKENKCVSSNLIISYIFISDFELFTLLVKNYTDPECFDKKHQEVGIKL